MCYGRVRIGLFLLVCIAVLPAWPAAVNLVENGRTTYAIVLPDAPTAAEQYAAAELQRWIKEMSGVSLVMAGKGSVPQRAVFVGRSATVDHIAPDINWDALEREGFVIRTVGDRLILAGGRPRGTLYAVYSFLEDQLGCRWFTADCDYIPKRRSIALPALNITHVPPLEYRETFTYCAFNGDWAARNFSNGNRPELTDKHGGKIIYTGFVHTSYQFLPPQTYFAAHPDWYAERNGKRTHDHAQLCLTNPEVVKAMTEAVRRQLLAHPETSIISISQNDCGGWCECPRCKAVDEEEGSHAGTLIRFVNQVAANLEPEFPHVAFDTLAYQYTRKPPLHVKPRANVIVRLCSIECCFSHPIATCPEDASFRDDIVGWSKICKRLYVWDYVTDFSHYLMPYPNLDVLASNIRFFVAHGVKGIFEEGNYNSPGGEMAELRAYMEARLLWNPNYSAHRAMDEFLQHYYGAAAWPIYRYIRLLHNKVEDENIHMYCFTQPTFALLTPDIIDRASDLFDEAERRVANDPVRLKRVQIARLPILYIQLIRGRAWARAAQRAGQQVSFDERAVADRFFRIADEAGIKLISEGGSLAAFRQTEMDRIANRLPVASPPPGTENLDPKRVIDIQDDEFSLFRPGQLSGLKQRAGASDGMAAWITGSTVEWAVQCHLSTAFFVPGKSYTAYAMMEVARKGTAGNAFQAGIYDTANRKAVCGITCTAAAAPVTWKAVPIGTFVPGEDEYVWIAPCNNPENVTDIYIDRIYFVQQN